MKNKIKQRVKKRWLILFVSILFLGNYSLLYAGNLESVVVSSQNKIQKLSGKVVDETGQPIIGATVILKETTTGVTTNSDGKFVIEANQNDVLKISFIGYDDYEYIVSNFEFATIILKERVVGLEDVVVVGFATQKRVNLTGAVTSVSTKDLESRPITNASMALAGKAAGVQVTQTSGKPGDDAGTITIRGVGTLNNASPLVIIDGFEGSFNDVDPKDIENISVLKDAASASIYGNKAANGVILITTKKGTEGKMRISYNGSQSVQTVTRYPEMLNSVQYMELMNEARLNSGQNVAYTQEYINNFKQGNDPQRYRNYQWSQWYFRPAMQTNHSLQVTGGNKQTEYLLSGNYLGQDGILQGTSFNKISYRANITSKFLNNRLKIITNFSGNFSNQKDLINGTDPVIERIAKMNPMTFPKIEGYGWNDWFYEDAVREAGGGLTKDNQQFNSVFGLNFKIIDGLVLDAAYNINTNIQLQQQYAPVVELYNVQQGIDGTTTVGEVGGINQPFVRKGSYKYGSSSSYATLNYQKNFLEKHNIGALAGIQQYRWSENFFNTEISKLNANIPFFNSGDVSTIKNSDWGSELHDLSYFGRLNYSYSGKYLLEANLRYDGASRFAKGHKWGLFPSYSAAWRVSEESFFSSLKSHIQNLKIRGSWGRLGNQNINNSYAGVDILGVGKTNYILSGIQQTGASLKYIANPNLSWETTTQSNIGIDLTFLKNWTLVVDAYTKMTDGILVQIPVSSTFGYAETPWQNAGKMTNKGVEITLSYTQQFTSDLRLDWSGSVSYNHNNVDDIAGRSPIIMESEIIKEGLPYNALYGYATEGIYQSEAEIQNHLNTFDKQGNVVNSYSGLIAKPGDIRFKDQNGDGIISLDKDRVYLGSTNPNYIFSTVLNASWKNFDLSVFFQGTQGAKGWNGGMMAVPFYNQNYNAANWVMNRWTPEKPNNTYQRVFIDNQRASIRSAYYVEDMSYLRMKNLELAYTVPKSFTKNKLQKIRVFISASNLFTLTKYKGFDPEQIPNANTFSNTDRYPQVKNYTIGLNLTL